MRPKMTITAAGDFMHYRMLPQRYEGFEDVKAFIERGDVRFFNLETVFPDETCFGNQFYGGGYVFTSERALNDARAFGFNILTFANNHAFDFSYNGLLRTLDAVRAAGFPGAGVGRNLDEASDAAFIQTPTGSLGLVAAVSTMGSEAAMAGRQSRRVLGRPGVNGLRIAGRIVVPEEQFKILEEIDARTGVNASDNILRMEGFAPPKPEGLLQIQSTLFEKGDALRYETHPNETDMSRVTASIENARRQSDYVAVSIHSHEVESMDKAVPPQFLAEFAHRCIDAGANAVFGHGPHILRPLEMYKGRPIFYSLGNFLFQDVAPYQPEDMYEKYGLTSDTPISALYDAQTAGNTRGLLSSRYVLESVIPCIEVEDDAVVKIELLPISLGPGKESWQGGLPAPGFGQGILERLQAMSAPYGTEIVIREDGIGEVRL
ncbi:MAG: CapA family protein [Clostridia bacterium]|nr:CapA family protein [Clostridia bacterium]